MMGAFDELTARAEQIFLQMQSSTVALKSEIAEAEKRKTQAQLALQQARSAINRLSRFVPEVRGNLQCPDCFMTKGVNATLQPIGGGSGAVDLFRCAACHAAVSINFRN